MRELERKFGAICRAVAVRVAEKEKEPTGLESSCVSCFSKGEIYFRQFLAFKSLIL